MKAKVHNVYWRNNIVGKIANIKVDNFDIYGDWKPTINKKYNEFISRLKKDEQLEIIIGEDDNRIKATIENVPDNEAEFKLRF